MYASLCPPEIGAAASPAASRQRAEGRVRLEVARFGHDTRIAHLSERGSSRLRVPRVAGPALEAVLINTGGGIAGGDSFETIVEAREATHLALTTVAAEKAYRSDGSTASVRVSLRVAAEARLDWLPQETILFDRARLRRRFEAELAPGGSLLVFEALVFGRAARKETVRTGLVEDCWRVRRGGRLVHADTLRLSGDVAAILARPTIAAGGRAIATLLLFADDAERHLEHIRDVLASSPIAWGASGWNGRLAIRMLSPEIDAVREWAARAITALRGQPMPRVWLT